MNDFQRGILLVAAILSISVGMCPPWQRSCDINGLHISESRGYHLIWQGPKISLFDFAVGATPNIPLKYWSYQIDQPRLYAQFAGLLAATALLYFAARTQPKERREELPDGRAVHG